MSGRGLARIGLSREAVPAALLREPDRRLAG
jgi:hypothetical protein